MSKKIVIIHELKDDADPLEVWEITADSFDTLRQMLKPIMQNTTVALIEEEEDGVKVADFLIQACDPIKSAEISY